MDQFFLRHKVELQKEGSLPVFITDYLLRRCFTKEIGFNSGKIQNQHPTFPLSISENTLSIAPLQSQKINTIALWDDVWSTSEAILALTMYYNLRKNTDLRDRISNITNVARQALQYLELENDNGQWGDTTSLTLRAYLKGHSIWGGKVNPQPHLLFKTLRWLCDEKQYFRDGSIWHSPNHTLFFVLAIEDIIDFWLTPNSALDIPVVDLYDYILSLLSAKLFM